MASPLDRLVDTAYDLIEKYGKTVSFAVTGSGTYDPTTGGVTGAATASYPRKVAPPSLFKQYFVNGDTIQTGDLEVWVAAKNLPFVPVRGRVRVTIDAKEFLVVQLHPVYSGELICLWQLQLRA